MRFRANFRSRLKVHLPHFIVRAVQLLLDRPEQLLTDSVTLRKLESKIPNTVFQTWETNYFGRRHYRSIKRFREQNPEFSFLLFDSTSRDRYMEENWRGRTILKVYRASVFGAMKADIFRYCILYDKGGYYFDISKGLKVPIMTLSPPESEFFVTQESTPLDDESMDLTKYGLEQRKFLQWGIGFVPRHPILQNVILEIEARSDAYVGRILDDPKLAILDFTGPGAFTRAVYSFLQNNHDLSKNFLGIDFFGSEIFALRGSGYRFASFPSYSEARKSEILVDNSKIVSD